MRHLQMTAVCSMDDHRQEAIAYLRENGLHGLVADDVEYAVFDPPRYFSASHLKMTYKVRPEIRKEMTMSNRSSGFSDTLYDLCFQLMSNLVAGNGRDCRVSDR